MSTELKSWLEQVLQARKALDEEIQKNGKSKFQEFMKSYWKRYPQIKGVAWSQYTPYFNDGDECIFRVNERAFITSDFDPNDVPREVFWNGATDDITLLSDWGEQKAKGLDAEAMETFESIVDDELFKQIFGDHVQVVITEKLVIEEYEHD